MSLREVFQKFYDRLIESLPMNDKIFLGYLYQYNLLPGDLYSRIQTKSTSVEKAVLFLDCTIQPSLRIGDYGTFIRLLEVIQQSDYKYMRELAHQIEIELKKSSDTAG